MSREIFISFSNRDRAKTDKIVDALEKLGVSCWYQINDSKGKFAHEISQGIKESKYFIAFVSNSSVESVIVQNEIYEAVDKHTDSKIARKRAAKEGDAEVLANVPEYKILPVELEPLDEENKQEANIFLGIFNWLFYSDYDSEMLLAMAICKQFGIQNDAIRESSYSAIIPLEQQRLGYQSRILALQMHPVLEKLCTELEQPIVLDVGCADGTATLAKFEGIPLGDYVGLDREFDDERMKTLYEGRDDVAFVRADLAAGEHVAVLKDIMRRRGIVAFDIIHISFVMLHIMDCVSVLRSLKQFLTPEGYLVIQDIDDDQTLVYPESRFFSDWKLIWDGSSETGDRRVGRKLPIYLKNAGYRNIRLQNNSLDSFSLGEEDKKAFWDALYNPKYWIPSEEDFVDYDTYLKLDKYRADHQKSHEQFMNNEVFVNQGIFIITAQV